MSKKLTTSLSVDQDNHIIELDDNWSDLAESYRSGPSLARQRVLYKSLGSFISDDNTLMYIEACLSLCRLRQQVLFRPYRCDSPTHKQFMELELTPLENRCVRMRHFLLKEEPFERPVVFQTLKPSANQSPKVKRCSMCNRLQAPGQSEWIAPEVFFINRSDDVQVIHTVCESCKNTSWQVRHRRD